MLKALIPAVLLVLGTAPLLDPSPDVLASIGPHSSELRYPANPDALREEFHQTGAVTLILPDLGPVSIRGEAEDPTSHGDRSSGGSYLSIRGHVVEHPNSTADILVGEYAAYGAVVIQGPEGAVWFEVDAEETTSGYVQWIHLNESSAPVRSLAT